MLALTQATPSCATRAAATRCKTGDPPISHVRTWPSEVAKRMQDGDRQAGHHDVCSSHRLLASVRATPSCASCAAASRCKKGDPPISLCAPCRQGSKRLPFVYLQAGHIEVCCQPPTWCSNASYPAMHIVRRRLALQRGRPNNSPVRTSPTEVVNGYHLATDRRGAQRGVLPATKCWL